MWILSAAVVIFGVLTTLNLILTLGVLKKLREQGEQLAHAGGKEHQPDPIVERGEVVDDFATTSLDGAAVTRAGATGLRLVAFVSPMCDMCAAQIPNLLDRAAHMPGGRDNVLITVVGKGDDVTEYAQQFRPLAQVVVEPGSGAVNRAFRLDRFPAYGLIDAEGRVVTSSDHIDRLDIPVAS